MHRFCTRFIFIALMMVPHILRSMLVENIEVDCCKRKKELVSLINEGGAQKVQYVQLRKITKGNLYGKPHILNDRSHFQIAGRSTILILQGIQTRDREILKKIQSKDSLCEPFLPIPFWKKHHDLSKGNKSYHKYESKDFNNLEIYENLLYLDISNNFTHSNIYLSPDSLFLSRESHYHSLLDHVRNLHEKEKYTFAILTKIKIRGNRYSHEGFLPIVVNKVGDILEYVGTNNIFDNSDESHWKDIFDKLRHLVEKPKELEELIVKDVQSEAKKEIDEMGLGDIAKEINDKQAKELKKQIFLEYKQKFKSRLRRLFCFGSIFGGAAIVFGFILLRLCGFKYARM